MTIERYDKINKKYYLSFYKWKQNLKICSFFYSISHTWCW